MSEERKSLTGSLFKGLTGKAVESLAKSVGINPSDRGWVTVDIGATLMSVSPKVALDFFRAAKDVSAYLESNDLRAWAEIGKRIALNSVEEASEFFRYSGETLGQLSEPLRVQLIALCSKQIVLSPQAALTTFRNAPYLAASLGTEHFASRLFAIAVEVAQRSVKHSTEVLTAAPSALTALREWEDVEADLSPTEATLALAENFAQRTGATAAEFLSAIGEGLQFV